MIDTSNMNQLIGAKAVDPNGDKIGTVGQVYVDGQGQPVWATVSTGLFGTSESFVPLQGADADADTLRVGYEKALVKDAPRIEVDGELSEAEEQDLYRHYGLAGGYADSGDHVGHDHAGHDHAGHGHEHGYDTSGPTTDSAMTRSEEQLNVGTQKVETGRARLRKHVVTEQQTVTVPVTREEVRLEREPITDANVGAATDGPAISEEEHEVVLTEERVVVNKETVPVERVRLGTETVTEQQHVTEDVRKERIELDDNGSDRAARS